ncbi:MAG: hypothetical protein WBC63_07745 [Candidatus Bipolaricaulia bacterium]
MQIGDIVLGLATGVGIDLSPDGTTAYYVEWSVGELCRVDTETGNVTTVQTELQHPEDVALDWDTGEIFVSERQGTIRRIRPGETAETLVKVGGAPQQLVLVKESGRRSLFTVCFDSGDLISIDVDSKATTTIAGGLGHPVGLAVDAARKLAFVTEQDSSSLTKIDLTAGFSEVLHGGLISPFFLAWDKTGQGLFCVQRDPANSLVKLNLGPPVTLETVATGLAWRPSGVALQADDTKIYICADGKLQVLSAEPVASVSSEAPPFEIHSIELNYAGSEAIPLKRHVFGGPVPAIPDDVKLAYEGSTPIPLEDHDSDTLIPTPEFVKDARSEPAAYVVGTCPRVRVVFRKLPEYAGGVFAIGATGNLGGVRRKRTSVTFQASGLSNPVEFELMWPLPQSVGKPTVSLEWFARSARDSTTPISIGSTDHKVYLTVDRPVEPWANETPWVDALELACEWGAGATTKDTAATAITRGLNGNGYLRYHGVTTFGSATYLLSSFLSLVRTKTVFYLNCTDCADAVVTLANLLGCDLHAGRMFDLRTRKFLELSGDPADDADWVWYDWSYHEIAWLPSIGPQADVYDGCLQLDTDRNDADTIHVPHLPVKMEFSSYRDRLVDRGPCTLASTNLRRDVA